MIINNKHFDIRPLEEMLADKDMLALMPEITTEEHITSWTETYNKYEAEAYKGISKTIQTLTKKYMLDVKAIISKGDHGTTYKIYQFSGNFLANFEALAREAKGYVKSTEYSNALVRV